MLTGSGQQRAMPIPHWSRPLAVATAAIFCVSTAFPMVAGLSKNTGAFPKWWGIADVVLAFVLAAMVFAVMVAAHGKISKQADDDTYSAYRILIHGIFVILVVFFLAGTDNLDQLSNRVRLARLAALVCLAFVVHRGENSCG